MKPTGNYASRDLRGDRPPGTGGDGDRIRKRVEALGMPLVLFQPTDPVTWTPGMMSHDQNEQPFLFNRVDERVPELPDHRLADAGANLLT